MHIDCDMSLPSADHRVCEAKPISLTCPLFHIALSSTSNNSTSLVIYELIAQQVNGIPRLPLSKNPSQNTPLDSTNLMHKFAPHMFLWEKLFFIFSIAFASAHSVLPSQIIYRFPNAEVLATQPEVVNYGLPLRVVVDDGEQKAIKYVFLNSNMLHGDAPTSFEQVSINMPRLPPGDWNEAHIHLERQTGIYSISNTTLTSRPGMTNNWDFRRIDYLEFVKVETLQHDRLQVVTHPDFDTPVLIKIASFPWEIPSLEREATVYRLLHGSGATPEFLGYVIEGGRAIGFITEYIEEELSIRDRNMQGCLVALHKLHQKGIAHGDAHNGNCLIRKDGSSVLIDFELSLETWAREEFERDLDIMGRCIQGISRYS